MSRLSFDISDDWMQPLRIAAARAGCRSVAGYVRVLIEADPRFIAALEANDSDRTIAKPDRYADKQLLHAAKADSRQNQFPGSDLPEPKYEDIED